MPRSLVFPLCSLLLLGASAGAQEGKIELNPVWADQSGDELRASLETLIQAKTAGVLNEAEVMSLKSQLLAKRPALSGEIKDAPLSEALLAVVSAGRKQSAGVSVGIRQRDLERLGQVRVTLVISQTTAVDVVRLLLDLAEDDDGRLSVEWDEPSEGVFRVRVHEDEEDEDEDGDEERDEELMPEGERPRPEAPRGAAPPARGWLGVSMEAPAPGQTGVRVSGLSPGGPAELAGVRVGDVIVALGEDPVASAEDLARLLAARAPGEQVRLLVLRGAQDSAVELRVKLGQR